MGVSKVVCGGRVLIDLGEDSISADKVVKGTTFHDAQGEVREGAAQDNGEQTLFIDGLKTTSVEIPAGFTSGGRVSLTDDIEEFLSKI